MRVDELQFDVLGDDLCGLRLLHRYSPCSVRVSLQRPFAPSTRCDDSAHGFTVTRQRKFRYVRLIPVSGLLFSARLVYFGLLIGLVRCWPICDVCRDCKAMAHRGRIRHAGHRCLRTAGPCAMVSAHLHRCRTREGSHRGDWRSGSALRSHRRGHWFEPSIAHPEQHPADLQTSRIAAGGVRIPADSRGPPSE